MFLGDLEIEQSQHWSVSSARLHQAAEMAVLTSESFMYSTEQVLVLKDNTNGTHNSLSACQARYNF